MAIKPKNDLHFRLGIMKEAMAKGVDALSEAFLIYQELRWYETDGKFGFCVASLDRLGEPYGFTETQVKNFLEYLQRAGLVEHIWCDKKVYRNKTKIWMSKVRLSGVGTVVEAMKVLDRGKKNKLKLSCKPEELKRAELIETADGSVEGADGSVEGADGSVEGADGSVVRIGVKQGSELYNELTNELYNKLKGAAVAATVSHKQESTNKRKVDKQASKESPKSLNGGEAKEPKKKVPLKKKGKKRFTKPTLEEVKAYCLEKDYQINAEDFYDYYEGTGWTRGKNQVPITNWKPVLSTWARNQKRWDVEKKGGYIDLS